MKRMPQLALTGFLAMAAALPSSALPAWADDSADAAAVRTTIERQMDAFKHDDASGAYAFASPGIKAMFSDAGHFLAMVHEHYAPVYDPKSVSFGELKPTDKGFTQNVTIIDRSGQAWTALYSLEKDADGQWHISGCVLVKNAETSV